MTAQEIISKFGGQSQLASMVQKGQSTVQYWASSGRIPAKWQAVLLDIGKREGIPIEAEDFIDSASAPINGKPTRERTIISAIKLVLQDSGKPLTLNEIFNFIVEGSLYIFNADNPLGVLHNQLRRHCRGLDFKSAHPQKYFGITPEGKYFLLEEGALKKTKRVDTKTRPTSTGLKRLHKEYLEEFKKHVLDKLRVLDPFLFEKFATLILRAYGFHSLKVTQKSRDGGIDGFGKLQVGLAEMEAGFQCKRWNQTVVGRPELDRFRGAISGDYQQGILFTTSRFSEDAKMSSFKKGAVPIVLIDGPSIVDIMIQKGVGIEKDSLPIYGYALDLSLE